jgi:formate dehydrogenase iron-sulfur subunit
MCYQKIKSGELKEPACTHACPTQATRFGERDELLAEAHRSIRANPGKYIDRVWGEHEVGGTNVLYLSNVDLGFLGWKPDLGTEPLPAKTWPALRIVPGVFLGVGAFMTAACWIINRRMKLADEQTIEVEGAPEEQPEAEQKKEEAESK